MMMKINWENDLSKKINLEYQIMNNDNGLLFVKHIECHHRMEFD